MNGDHLWNSIEAALDRPLDPALFERCMQDILREVYPTLVPVVGGSDGGSDGAIASIDGPFPLICTTSSEVIGNFRKNIGSHLSRRGGPRRCVLATSQQLTPRRRENIHSAARELGVSLVQIHDQSDVVGRLYQNSHWRIELLGITGNPPALSMLPPQVRSLDASLVVGREADLSWLRNTPGDLLLVGQPGCGKTHLHQHLAHNGAALFLVEADPTRVANAIREQKPSVIVVDDAHCHADWLDFLRRIRHEIGAQYSIHANCWPGFETEVRERIDIAPDQVRSVELLPQRTVRELIEARGIKGPDALLYLLITQAEGRPGLAAALVDVCKRDGVERIWSGEAVADSLLGARSIARDGTDRAILAVISLGGQGGMDASVVAAALDVKRADLRDRLAALGAGGVVRQLDQHTLAVSPPALRAVLVRDFFFSGPHRLDFKPLVEQAPQRATAIEVLLSARQRGASVPFEYLEDAVVSLNSRELWEHFGCVDDLCARTILDKHPQHVSAAVRGLLQMRPAETLHAVIIAHTCCEAGYRCPGNPLDEVRRWLCPWESIALTSERRRQLVSAIEKVLGEAAPTDAATFASYIAAAIAPGVVDHSPRPGEPLVVQVRRGILPLDLLRCVADLWPRVLRSVSKLPAQAWEKLLTAASDWVWPARNNSGLQIPEQVQDFMRAAGRGMLANLLELPNCPRAAKTSIAWIIDFGRLDLQPDVDPVFDLLFQSPSRQVAAEQAREDRRAALRELADQLISTGADSGSAKLGSIERDAVAFGRLPDDRIRIEMYSRVADHCDDPASWLRALVAQRVPARFIAPFLQAARKGSRATLEQIIAALMAVDPYRSLGVLTALETEDSPQYLLEEALNLFDPASNNADRPLASANIPLSTMRRLLTHPKQAVRAAAAIGECTRTSLLAPRPELLRDWSEAVVAIDNRGCPWLEDIFQKYPELARAWTADKIRRGRHDLFEHNLGFFVAAKVLGPVQRFNLLLLMNSFEHFDADCFDALIGADFDLFRRWYRTQTVNDLRLQPLERAIDDRWERYAAIAIEEGATGEEVADRIGQCCHSTSADSYRSHLPRFERLSADADPKFQMIGRRGIAWVEIHVTQAEHEERVRSIYGS